MANESDSTVSKSMVIPPPVKGWNTKDPLVGMDPGFAIEMENYFPNGSAVELRKGSTIHGTTTGSPRTLIEYSDSGGTQYLLAVDSGGLVFNATSSGAATDISGGATVTTTAAGYVSYINFNNRVFIKGYDTTRDVYVWAGTGNIALAAFTGPSGDDKSLDRITVYNNRLYFVGRGTAKVWYGEVAAVTGALTSFDFSTLFRFGGNLVYIGAYSGSYITPQDLFVAISSNGEVLLYQGDYPGSVSWSRVGQFKVAPPIGPLSFFKWGNDIVILTIEGAIALSSVINSSQTGDYSYLSDNIQSAFTDLDQTVAVGAILTNGIHYPKGRYILINGYDTGTSAVVQYVMNTLTRAWCKFSNQTATSWAVVSNALYFANPSAIMKADNGYFDEDPANAGQILTRNAKLRPAYNYFNGPESVKTFTEAQLFVYESEGLDITCDADVDYSNTTATSRNVDSTKGTSYQFYNNRIGLKGVGNAASIRFDGTVTTKRRSIQAIKVFYKEGGIR